MSELGVQLTKEMVLDIAYVCHSANVAWRQVNGYAGGVSWENLPSTIQDGMIAGVHAVLENPLITGIEMHAKWCESWVLGAPLDGPVKNDATKEHPNLVEYEKLPEAKRRKDDLFIAIVVALSGGFESVMSKMAGELNFVPEVEYQRVQRQVIDLQKQLDINKARSNSMQNDVRDFMIAMGQKVRIAPTAAGVSSDEVVLRKRLHREECNELDTALAEGDLIGIADGICDLMYVVLGTANTYGIDLIPLWNEVQRTNMLKSTGPVREDGKRLKPDGWAPPEIGALLIEQGWDQGE